MNEARVISQSQARSLPAAPGLKVSDSKISAVGGVGRSNANVSFNRPLPRIISVTLDNSGGVAKKSYMIFDAIGAVAAATGGSYTAPTSVSGLGATVINKSIESNPLAFNGFNYRITTGSSAQFDENFLAATAGLDKSLNQVPVVVQGSIRNTQNNEKLLTIEQELLIDQMSGIIIDVAAATTVAIDFFVQAQYNAF